MYKAQKVAIETQIPAAPLHLELLMMALAKINNEIATIEFELAQPVEVHLMEQEKTEN